MTAPSLHAISDPRVAFALGMLHKLQQLAPSNDAPKDAELVQQALSQEDCESLLGLIEESMSMEELTEALHPLLSNVPPDKHEIPDALSCSICTIDIMLKPCSLPCGHSFCKPCLEHWLRQCQSCPTCRQSVDMRVPLAVDTSLQTMARTNFPDEYLAAQKEDEAERCARVHACIADAVAKGNYNLQTMLADDLQNSGETPEEHSAHVQTVLSQDPELHDKILSLQIRDQLRKERQLREESRRRHMSAYGAVRRERSGSSGKVIDSASRRYANRSNKSSNKTKPSRFLAQLIGRKD